MPPGKEGAGKLKCDFHGHDSVIALAFFIWNTNTDIESEDFLFCIFVLFDTFIEVK